MIGKRTPTSSPELPPALGDDAAVFLRPLGLITGRAARETLSSGRARALAGGPLAFTACEVAIREGVRVTRGVVDVGELDRWTSRLAQTAVDRIGAVLERLCAPRTAPDGSPLRRPLLMGIVNVTPDSFSDAGEALDTADAVDRAVRLAGAGADILDVGGESTRPGARPVDAETELRRVLPVLEALARRAGALAGVTLSIDTRKAAVMRAALRAGASMINDVTALSGDPDSLAVAAETGATVALMHMRGEPATMNLAPRYADAALDVFAALEARVAACEAAGIPRARLVVDPGIAFGKHEAHNLEILGSLALYHGLGCPILLGVSRKGLTGAHEARWTPKQRLPSSLAAAVLALQQGVQMLRVHDVAETRQAVDVWQAVAEEGG